MKPYNIVMLTFIQIIIIISILIPHTPKQVVEEKVPVEITLQQYQMLNNMIIIGCEDLSLKAILNDDMISVDEFDEISECSAGESHGK